MPGMDDLWWVTGATFLLSVLLTYLVKKIAPKLGWVSIPRADRWNVRPVALMGGVAVFTAASVVFFALGLFDHILIWLGGAIMFVVGFWDDGYGLKPIAKFLAQFLVASMLVSAGYTVGSELPFWLALPLTYLWIIGITNAFNLLDNMDGLTAGVSVIVCAVLGGLALTIGSAEVALMSFILGGAVAGFLVFNYNPAKIFMGDSGSLFIGFIISALALMLEPAFTAVSPAYTLAVMVAITIVPFFDTTMVTAVRLFKGRSPSEGGKDHSSHRLVFSGMSERGAVNLMYGIALYFGAIVFFLYPDFINLFYNLFVIGLLGLVFFGMYLSRLDVYEDKDPSMLEEMVDSIPPFFKRKIQLGIILSDIILVIVSLILAHYIRFEGWSAAIEESVIDILPAVIVMKVLILAAFGGYKSVWQYAGVHESVRLMIGSFLGSVGAGLFAWSYSGAYLSVSVFAIDWLIFMLLVASSRFAFKGLRRLFSMPGKGGQNTLIYGAGDGGWLALSEIRQNDRLDLNIVGFIDDSPYKQKGEIQGLKILGTSNDLLEICREYEVDVVLICIRNLLPEKKNMVMNICQRNSITCKKIIPAFDLLDSMEEEQEDWERGVMEFIDE